MSESGSNPFLIQPPPGIVPPPLVEPPAPAPLADELPIATALIALPPGVETGTYKVAPTRGVEPTKAPTGSPNFFPTPGAAILPTAAPTPAPTEPEPTPEPVRAPQPRAVETPTAPPVQASPTWRLTLPHGDAAVDVAGAVVIGRSPVVLPEYSTAQLVKASDPGRSVSKTHALLGIDANGLWVADLGSTNGTFVITPTGGDVKVEPGAPVYVPAGSDVELGQYIIQVEYR
jgi:hypothetical protein